MSQGCEQKTFLAASVVLDAANGAGCAKAVTDCLSAYGVYYEIVIALVTNGANYNEIVRKYTSWYHPPPSAYPVLDTQSTTRRKRLAARNVSPQQGCLQGEKCIS